MKPALSITQATLAKRLGVSQTLVSRVLSGQGSAIGAAPETIRRILHEAQEAGYRPSHAALVLRGGPTHSFGVSVRDFSDPFFGLLLGEIQQAARRSGYTLLLTGGHPGDMAALRRHAPDGLIILGGDLDPEGLDLFSGSGTPMVRIGHGEPIPNIVEVSIEESLGLNALVEHLLRHGHRRMEFIGADAPISRRRAAILQSILDARGHPDPIRTRLFSLPPFEAGRAGVMSRSSLRRSERPTALLTAEDSVALGALRACSDLGLRVPADLSIVGMDDLPFSAATTPSLTTIRQPLRPLVRAAFDVILGKRETSNRLIRVRPTLICRESSGPAPQTKTNPKREVRP